MISQLSSFYAFTRGGEHLEKWAARDENNSVLWLHSLHHHQGREEEVEYEMRVTGSYKAPLDQLIMESVQISTFPGPVLIKDERFISRYIVNAIYCIIWKYCDITII